MTEQDEKNDPLKGQVGGDHYRKMGAYQPWAVLPHWLTPDELRGFAKGTVIAYLARERDKGGIEDILKSMHTLQLYERALPPQPQSETPPSAPPSNAPQVEWQKYALAWLEGKRHAWEVDIEDFPGVADSHPVMRIRVRLAQALIAELEAALSGEPTPASLTPACSLVGDRYER